MRYLTDEQAGKITLAAFERLPPRYLSGFYEAMREQGEREKAFDAKWGEGKALYCRMVCMLQRYGVDV